MSGALAKEPGVVTMVLVSVEGLSAPWMGGWNLESGAEEVVVFMVVFMVGLSSGREEVAAGGGVDLFGFDFGLPVDDGEFGEWVDAEAAEHVEALSAVVGSVRGDVDEACAAGDAVAVAVEGDFDLGAEVGVGVGEGEGVGERGEFGGGGVEEFDELVWCAVAVVAGDGELAGWDVDGRAEWALGEAVAPAAEGGDDVGEGVVEGAGADVEAGVELVGGELAAEFEDAAVGPVVVEEEDVERI
jgi:hypothetical protein